MREIFKGNLEKDDFEYMNKFDDYECVTPDTFQGPTKISLPDRYSEANRKVVMYQSGEAGSKLFNGMPAEIASKQTICFREVYWGSQYHVVVKLTEAWPVTGRIWINFYNTNAWGGWRTYGGDIGPIGSKFLDLIYHSANMTQNHLFCHVVGERLTSLYYKFKISGLVSVTANLADSNACGIYLPPIRNAFGLPTLNAVDAVGNGVVEFFTPTDSGKAIYDIVANGYGGAFAKVGNDGLRFGRFYNESGNFGTWEDRVVNGKYIKAEIYLRA